MKNTAAIISLPVVCFTVSHDQIITGNETITVRHNLIRKSVTQPEENITFIFTPWLFRGLLTHNFFYTLFGFIGERIIIRNFLILHQVFHEVSEIE